MKFVVLGGTGSMGRISVRDLFETCKDCEIVIGGRDFRKAHNYAKSFKSNRVRAARIDVTDIKKTSQILAGASVCLNAVQYYFNLDVMRACLKAGVHYVDLGGLFHMTRRQLKLDGMFRKKKLTAILGCGGTPGITNVMIAYAARSFDTLHYISIRFGGYDWTKYKRHFVLPYTAYTLFDEFTDKPAVFKDGRLKFVKPMTGKDIYVFPKPVGKKTCFYTLHSELATIPKNYKKKGLKNCSFRVCFPEDFVHDVNLLIELRLSSKNKIEADGSRAAIRDVVAKEINRQALPKRAKIKDMEFIWADLAGTKSGKKKKISIYCMSKSNQSRKASAGDVDTGVPLSIIAQMIASGKIKEHGVFPPEECVEPELFFKELKKRGMKIFINRRKI